MRNFKVKSIHLDCARSFIPMDELHKRIEEFSSLGFTHLQLGLSDDQGWRFESKLYPKLHKLGSTRDRMLLTKDPNYVPDEKPYSGYYKQSELKKLVKFAKSKCMEIIPLINIPGHSTAAIFAYPELASGPVVTKVTPSRGSALFKSRVSTICYTSEFTKQWVKDIYGELMSVFSGEYIHLGFDEIAHGSCEKCDNCNLDTLIELLNPLYNQVLSVGRKPIIWWRIEKNNIDISKFPDLTIQWWGASSLYKNKCTITNDIIFSQPANLYYDYPEFVGGRLTILDDMGVTLVSPHGLAEKINKMPDNVIGIGACLWTENLYDEILRSNHLYPRLNHLSEILAGREIPKPIHSMNSWISSSYTSSLIKLIRGSNLHTLRKGQLRDAMNSMNMGEILKELDTNFKYIDFRSIPLTKISNSIKAVTPKSELDLINSLYS